MAPTAEAPVIFALATAPGRAAVAILRGSGKEAAAVLKLVAGALPAPRLASLRTLRDASGAALDQALVLWLPGPGSYTGEDSFELHLHGGPAVVEAVSSALVTAGARAAEPGEFTRRAFEHGRLDLAQAEAVADLVDAETQGQRRQALDQLDGALSRRHEAWRALVIDALAMLEAAVDFPDEELPADLAARATPPLRRLADELAVAIAESARGERVRSGYRIALLGAPNAGKSSLLNALAGRDAAIVAPEAGTTRDVIEVPLVIAGYKALLADTAGMREAVHAIEIEGVRRARAWAEGADLRLWVIDASAGDRAWREAAALVRPGDLALLNKSDLPAGSDAREAGAEAPALGAVVMPLSLTDRTGLTAVHDAVAERIVADLGGAGFPAGTRERHRQRLQDALDRVRRAEAMVAAAPELAAEDVRLAARALDEITGRVGVEAVLDRVFSAFCIGK